MKKYFYLLIALILLSDLNSTSWPAPYYEYNCNGYLVCDSISSKANYTLRLYGKNNSTDNYFVIYGDYAAGEQPIYVTDESGYFYLSVNGYERFDSLKLGIVLPGKPIYYSKAHYVDENHYIEFTESYRPERKKIWSCSSEPQETRITHYSYTQNDIHINICGLWVP